MEERGASRSWTDGSDGRKSRDASWKGRDLLRERAASFFQRAGREDNRKEVPHWVGDLDVNLRKTSIALSSSMQDLQKAAETRLRAFPLRATKAIGDVSTNATDGASPTSTLTPWQGLRRTRSDTDVREPIKGDWEDIVKALESKIMSRGDWPRRTLARRGSSSDLEQQDIKSKRGIEQRNKGNIVQRRMDEIVKSAKEAANEKFRIVENQWKRNPSSEESADITGSKREERRHAAKTRGAGMSMADEGLNIAIVTTASLPWLTGTSVNPLLRAAYLSKMKKKVTLLVPWLSPEDQKTVYHRQFASPEEQEGYVREWLRARVGFESDFRLEFYPGRYAPEKGSILPVGDLTRCISDDAEVAILEEPEHLNWYHHGERWSDKFQHVVGIVHTNYLEYAKREENGDLKAGILKKVNQWVCRAAGCDKIIKLSDVVQELPRARTCFVHGVSPRFLEVGKHKSDELVAGKKRGSVFPKGVYFLGKVVWGKGYTELIEILNHHRRAHGINIDVDVYGHGDDFDSVKLEAENAGLALNFHGARDHADSDIHDYKVFINPSLSDVVATTTAEALAMGKFVVCADHPSNAFFRDFPNCLTYKDNEEFSKCISKAMREEPKPLSEDQRRMLTWEAATERLLDVAEPESRSLGERLIGGSIDRLAYLVHNSLSGVEDYRVTAGAGGGTRDCLEKVTDVAKFDSLPAVRGILDRK